MSYGIVLINEAHTVLPRRVHVLNGHDHLDAQMTYCQDARSPPETIGTKTGRSDVFIRFDVSSSEAAYGQPQGIDL